MKIGPNMSLDMAEGNSVRRLNMFSDFSSTISSCIFIFSSGDTVDLIISPKFKPTNVH